MDYASQVCTFLRDYILAPTRKVNDIQQFFQGWQRLKKIQYMLNVFDVFFKKIIIKFHIRYTK